MGIPRRHDASHVCKHAIVILVFIRRDTARYRTKGYNGSNSHPKAGLSWPMAYPYRLWMGVGAIVNFGSISGSVSSDEYKDHNCMLAHMRRAMPARDLHGL